MRSWIAAVVCLFLVACSSGAAAPRPRVTTEAERIEAERLISTGVLALNALRAAGRMNDDHKYELALQQIAELRKQVQDSATVPIDAADLLLRAGALAIAWIPPRDRQ